MASDGCIVAIMRSVFDMSAATGDHDIVRLSYNIISRYSSLMAVIVYILKWQTLETVPLEINGHL